MWPFRPKSDRLFNRNFTFEPKPQLTEEDYFQLSPKGTFPSAYICAFAEDDDDEIDSVAEESMEESAESSKRRTVSPFPSLSPSAGLTRYEESIQSDVEEDGSDDDCGSFIINESEVASIISVARPEVTCVEVQRPRTAQPEIMNHFLDLSDTEDEEEEEESWAADDEEDELEDTGLNRALVDCYGKSPEQLQLAVQSLLDESPTSSHSNSIVDLIKKGAWFEEEEELEQDNESTAAVETETPSAPFGLYITIPPLPKSHSWLMEASLPNTPDEGAGKLRISWLPKSYASSLSSTGLDFFMFPDDSKSGDMYLTPEPSPLLPSSPFTPTSPAAFRNRLSSSSRNYKTANSNSSRSTIDRMNSLVLRHYSIDMAAGMPKFATENMSHEAYGELYWPENA